MSKFYAVGIGPGDPDLITVKAIKTIEKSDIIALPVSGVNDVLAKKITHEYIKNKEILYLDMPMIKDSQKLKECHENAAKTIAKLLDENKVVSFLTLGDPTIYSTAMYVHKIVTDMGYDTAVVSGITSFCAAAAALNQTLCEKDDILHIIPATFSDINEVNKLPGNKILMKSGKTILDVKEKLKGKNAMLVECATMENEKVYHKLEDLKEASSYFSIVFVKE